MADLTVVNPSLSGNLFSPVAASAGGDTIPVQRGGKYLLYVNNAGGSSINVTLDDPNSVGPDGASQFNPDVVMAVANGTAKVQKIAANRFVAGDGKIHIAYSATTSVTVAVLGPVNI